MSLAPQATKVRVSVFKCQFLKLDRYDAVILMAIVTRTSKDQSRNFHCVKSARGTRFGLNYDPLTYNYTRTFVSSSEMSQLPSALLFNLIISDCSDHRKSISIDDDVTHD